MSLFPTIDRSNAGENGMSRMKNRDIEDLVVAAMKAGEEDLDKKRGFIKYKRQKVIYRPPEQRLKDWDEVGGDQLGRDIGNGLMIGDRMTAK